MVDDEIKKIIFRFKTDILGTLINRFETFSKNYLLFLCFLKGKEIKVKPSPETPLPFPPISL